MAALMTTEVRSGTAGRAKHPDWLEQACDPAPSSLEEQDEVVEASPSDHAPNSPLSQSATSAISVTSPGFHTLLIREATLSAPLHHLLLLLLLLLFSSEEGSSSLRRRRDEEEDEEEDEAERQTGRLINSTGIIGRFVWEKDFSVLISAGCSFKILLTKLQISPFYCRQTCRYLLHLCL